ncbi:hypothetical protein BB561_006116 [Smittium simulii]|uniref:Signal recognition particle subunit SRP68 n=1 Tax=Smittium simulii TaxID=133385 RepID=A0A2T9Y6L1_9FUNG|nr:hypothetical protein BB561_006116 [Smittium simulii]
MDSTTQFNSICYLAKIRALHGHDERNHSKYEAFVFQRLRSLRKLLFGFKKGYKYAKYKKRSITDLPQGELSPEQFEAQIEYQLLQSEKAYSTAKILEEQYSKTEEPRHRYHMIRRFNKSIKEGLALVDFLQNHQDAQTNYTTQELLNAVIIIAEREAELSFKQEQYDKALYLFSQVRNIIDNILSKKKSNNFASKSYNSLFSENNQIIRFSAYKLNIENSRTDPIQSITKSFLSTFTNNLETSIGDLSKFIELSILQPDSDSTIKISSKFDGLIDLTFGFAINEEILKAFDSVPEIGLALTSQNQVFAKLFDSLKLGVNKLSLDSLKQDFEPSLQSVIDTWASAILKAKQLISDSKAATKYCQFNYSSIMALKNLVCALFILSSSSFFTQNSTISQNGHCEWWNVSQPNKTSVVQTLVSRQFTSNKKLIHKSRKSKKSSKSQNLKTNLDFDQMSAIPKLILYLDNLSYHSKKCYQISCDFKLEHETDIVNFASKYCTSLRDIFSAYSLLQPSKVATYEAKSLLLKAQKGLEATSKISTKFQFTTVPRNVFELLATKNTDLATVLGLAKIESLSVLVTNLLGYVSILDLSEKNIGQSIASNDTTTSEKTNIELLPLQAKPIFYDLAGMFIDFDFDQISSEAGISQSDPASFKISSIFNSFLGR